MSRVCLPLAPTQRSFRIGWSIMPSTGQPSTTSATVADLVAIARACGIANCAWAADEADFDRLVAVALKGEGPSLIAARIDNKSGAEKIERDPVQIRERFMRGLGVRGAGA